MNSLTEEKLKKFNFCNAIQNKRSVINTVIVKLLKRDCERRVLTVNCGVVPVSHNALSVTHIYPWSYLNTHAFNIVRFTKKQYLFQDVYIGLH